MKKQIIFLVIILFLLYAQKSIGDVAPGCEGCWCSCGDPGRPPCYPSSHCYCHRGDPNVCNTCDWACCHNQCGGGGPSCHACGCCIPTSCPGGTASLNFAQSEENKNNIANIFSPPSQIVFRPKIVQTVKVSPNPNTAQNSWNDLLIQLKEIINKILSPWRQLGMVR